MFRFAVIFFLALCPLKGVFAMQQNFSLLKLSNAQEVKKQDKEKKNKKPENQKPKQPEIKEVPKAKKQVKPVAVKPNVKVKPIKIIKPKIKRP